MLRGRFGNTSGRPYLEGRVILPRLNTRSDISFVVDTGADKTLLMLDDVRRMGIDYSRLKLSRRESIGTSGTTRHYEEPGIIVFEEAGRLLHHMR